MASSNESFFTIQLVILVAQESGNDNNIGDLMNKLDDALNQATSDLKNPPHKRMEKRQDQFDVQILEADIISVSPIKFARQWCPILN